MTRTEAEQAAKVLWGSAGAVERRQDRNRARRFVVGNLEDMPLVGVTMIVLGAGASFEEAFADAAANPAEERMRMPSPSVLLEQAKAQAMADMLKKTQGPRNFR